jgi:hypothetical protein
MTMKVELIQRRLRGGFRPFVLHLSDGRKYEVPHPEFILVAQHSVAVAVKDGYIDSLDPDHIVSLKDLALKHRDQGPRGA